MLGISCVYVRLEYSNGEIVYCLYSGKPLNNCNVFFEEFVEWAVIQKRGRSIKSDVYIMKANGESILLVSSHILAALIINNDTVLLVLSSKSKYAAPNNAAIYNADGTLRHQLINPRQEEGWYIHSTYYADFASLKGYGVMVTNDHEWPELCFCLYDGSPSLIWTGYQLERR